MQMARIVHAVHGRSLYGGSRWLTWLPIPLVLLAIVILRLGDIDTIHSAPMLLLLANLVLLAGVSLLVAGLVGHSFVSHGSPGLLLLGCGALLWAGSAVAPLLGGVNRNASITIHNSLTWLSAVCHLAGMIFSLTSRRVERLRAFRLALAYVVVGCVFWLLVTLTLNGRMPTFFVEGLGGTALRSFLLSTAAIMFAVTAVALQVANRRSISDFVHWYSLGLLLMASGLVSIMMGTVFDGLLIWLGRLAQYLGGGYILIAALAAIRNSSAWTVSLAVELDQAVRRSEARFRLLSHTAGQLLATDNPQGLVEQLCHDVMAHLDCQVFFNFLLDEQTGRLRLNACAGIDQEEARRITWLDCGVAVCGCVARDGQRIIAEDIQHSADERANLVRGYGVQVYCCHPLRVGGRTIGTLSFGATTRPRFTDDEIELMRTVADHVSNAMVRVRTEQALRQANAELDARVQERTEELTRTVEALQGEVLRRRQAEQVLRQRSEQLRALASELTLAEQRERRRLAAVLHDNLQQLLVGAKFRLSTLDRCPDSDARQVAHDVRELLSESIACSRSLTGELSPPILHQGGLLPAMEWLVRWMEQKHGLRVELAGQDIGGPPSEDINVLLFESVRELLFNTVKHSGVKHARVELTRTDDHIEVAVSDDGAGFDPAAIDRRAPGGGFGLLSIRERLSLLGGRMEVRAAVGRGSRFRLIAPAGPAAVAPNPVGLTDAADGEATALAEADGPAGPAERKIRVLVVDDHEVVRQGLSHLLRGEADIEVVGEAADGLSAIDLVRRLRPDVVTMDVSMPGMDGIETTRRIRGEFRDVRVIGLSMFEQGERAREMTRAGADCYLTKSGASESLLEAIRACGRRESGVA